MPCYFDVRLQTELNMFIIYHIDYEIFILDVVSKTLNIWYI